MKRSWPQLALVGALALSVIANVFLLGAVARNIGGGSDVGMLAENAGRAYTAEVRSEFRRLLRENRPRTLAALRDLRQARQRLAAAANAEALDEAELEIAMREVRASTQTLQRTVQDILLEALRRTRGAG